MRTEFGGGVPEESAFSRALATLKRDGSNILVVGVDGADPPTAVCRRLLGEDTPRRRVVVRTDDGATCGWHPPEDVDGSTRVIVHDRESDPDATSTVVDTDLLGPLAAAVGDAIDDAERAVEGLDPAELRFCFDALGPLFSAHDPETVFRLLHVLTARVREVNGMGHFHLRVEADDEHVNLLEPLFDAVVRVRAVDGGHEHRWHVLDQDVESEWIGP